MSIVSKNATYATDSSSSASQTISASQCNQRIISSVWLTETQCIRLTVDIKLNPPDWHTIKSIQMTHSQIHPIGTQSNPPDWHTVKYIQWTHSQVKSVRWTHSQNYSIDKRSFREFQPSHGKMFSPSIHFAWRYFFVDPTHCNMKCHNR